MYIGLAVSLLGGLVVGVGYVIGVLVAASGKIKQNISMLIMHEVKFIQGKPQYKFTNRDLFCLLGI